MFFFFFFFFARLSYIVNWAWSPWFNDIRLTRRTTRTTKSQIMGCEFSHLFSVPWFFYNVRLAVPFIRGEGGGVVKLSHRRPEFEARVVHVGFMVNKVVPAHLSLRILQVFPVKIISPTLHSRISFIYLRHYKILVIDSIIKSPAKKIRHVQFVPSITANDMISKPEGVICYYIYILKAFLKFDKTRWVETIDFSETKRVRFNNFVSVLYMGFLRSVLPWCGHNRLVLILPYFFMFFSFINTSQVVLPDLCIHRRFSCIRLHVPNAPVRTLWNAKR
jgi:hypothetical protein